MSRSTALRTRARPSNSARRRSSTSSSVASEDSQRPVKFTTCATLETFPSGAAGCSNRESGGRTISPCPRSRGSRFRETSPRAAATGPRTLSTPKWRLAREARSACRRRRVSGLPPISSESRGLPSGRRHLNSTATRTEPAPAPAAAHSHASMNLLMLLATFCWAAYIVAGKEALRGFGPLALSQLRALGAALVFLLVFLAWPGRPRIELTRRKWLLMAALSLSGVTLNQLFFIGGLARTSVAHTGLIVALGPVMVLFLSCLLRLE